MKLAPLCFPDLSAFQIVSVTFCYFLYFCFYGKLCCEFRYVVGFIPHVLPSNSTKIEPSISFL
jgi:hypothetical protein